MKNLSLLACFILIVGCAEGGDGTDGAGGLPEGSSVTCGDFEVDLSSAQPESDEPSESGDELIDEPNPGIGNPAVSRAVFEKIDELHDQGLDVVEVKYTKESVIVVGCGGTIINNETNVTNDVSGPGTQD